MFDTKTVSLEWGGKTLTLETGRIARQADGAVLATYGETVVLCAVTAAKSVKDGQDFFPLTVHYQEKFSAAGRIPGGFFKREGRATEKETLVSRLIDRPVRPLFPEGFYNEINVICQVLSYDGETEPDILAMIAASAALTISGVPFMGPIGAARVGFSNDGEYILNPSLSDALGEEGRLDLVVAATNDAVMMVESEAKELTEEEMLGAVMFAHEESRKVIGAIVDPRRKRVRAIGVGASACHLTLAVAQERHQHIGERLVASVLHAVRVGVEKDSIANRKWQHKTEIERQVVDAKEFGRAERQAVRNDTRRAIGGVAQHV